MRNEKLTDELVGEGITTGDGIAEDVVASEVSPDVIIDEVQDSALEIIQCADELAFPLAKKSIGEVLSNLPHMIGTKILSCGIATGDSLKRKFYSNPKKKIEDFKGMDKIDKKKNIIDWFFNNALYIMIAVFTLIVFISDVSFLSFASIMNVVKQSAASVVLALGIAGIIVLTGTDLSAGRAMGLMMCIVGSLVQGSDAMNKMWPNISYNAGFAILALVVVIVVGGIIGAFNGFFIAKFKLHPFIVTLGTQLIIYGLVQIYVGFGDNNGGQISGFHPAYLDFIRGGFTMFGVLIPNYLWIAVAVIGIMWFIWNKTIIGKNMYAVGCNPEAAKVSGVSVFKTIMIIFIIAGMLYGVSAFVEAGRYASVDSSSGVNAELDAIAACVIGGVSFMGGVGKISGVITGVVLLKLVNAGLIFLGLTSEYITIIKGVIILVAVALDMRKYIAKK